ncbi:hypothetical protein SAMN06265348_101223 [Pedobacter westerhofensis]|uniref:T9SS C-terminal target domain-containing protein n=1 Tax=Pedobacter westerhofensis TaxID=425512 RepID=A0A521AIA5_9SPHI|nr:UDP-N-acetyl glucosamine 2-epimerase [Pedobacter westerhofensis]SMO34488.1 hypothetical protein SAMN06265348_101223 [Pedobacter westerhofensis]
MKRFTKQALAIVAIAAFAVAGCKKGSDGSFNRANEAGGPFTGADSVISGNITESRTLSPGKVYKLNGIVFVTGGAKLTIQPGTVITTGAAVGYRVSPTAAVNQIAGVLVITKTGTIDALGTPDQPIVFTTPNAPNTGSTINRRAGDFGGVIVLGQSTTNKPATQEIEGLPKFDANGNSLGIDISYGGGAAPAGSSGTIQYVRIEYAGFKLAPDNEINGLTLGGVGSGTTIDHVQVSFGADDAFEFFGGTVNARYLLAVANDDDDFDTDFGYTGHIEYAIGLKDPSSTHSTSGTPAVSDSNGIESDNDADASSLTPKTKPVYTHFTLLGYSAAGNSTLRAGNRWRRNTDLSITKSIIAGYNVAAEFQTGTETSATPGGFTDNTVHAFNTPALNPTTAVSLTGSVNSIATASGDIANPAVFIALGSTSANPFYTTANSGTYSFLNLFPSTSTDRGAVNSGNIGEWNSGWVNFTPQTSLD